MRIVGFVVAGLGLAVLAGLAACSPPHEAAPPSAAAADGWTGTYTGGDLKAVITRQADGYGLTLSVSKADHACAGRVATAADSPATVSPDNTILTASVTDALAGDDGQCTVTLTRQGPGMVAEEGGDCTKFHGETCSFNGTLAPAN